MAQSFQDALCELINRHSMENGSDTPDYMLAEHLCDCLATYEVIIAKREKWYGRQEPGRKTPAPVQLHPLQRIPE